MELKYLLLVAGFVFGLLGGFSLFAWIAGNPKLPAKNKALVSVLGLNLMVIIISSIGVFFPAAFHDFINPQDWTSWYASLAVCAVLSLLFYFIKPFRWRFLVSALVIIPTVFMIPALALHTLGNFPAWSQKVLSALIWLMAIFGLRILSALPGLVPVQLAATGFGLGLVSLLGGAPILLGLAAFGLGGISLAFSAYNQYPSRLELTPEATDILGIILGWLLVSYSAEGSAASALLLCLYPLCEITWAGLKKLTFLPGWHNIYANTVYFQANISGLNPRLITAHLGRLNVVLILFACFQVYAPNEYSLPALCLVIVLWNIYRLYFWRDQPKNLKEINHQFIDEVKTGLDKIKKNFNSDH